MQEITPADERPGTYGRDWTKGSISKNLLHLSWPLVISQMLNISGPTIDMIWVGRLGTTSIAAVGAGGMIVMLTMSALMGLALGTRALIARYMGARDLGSRSITWNSSTGYPVEIGQAGSPLNYADIALPADYSTADPYGRQVFASWNKGSAHDIIRISDYQVYRIGAPEAVSSIAYYGSTRSGKLLAGAARCRGGGGCYQVQTYLSGNAVSNYPAWQPGQKAPTGSRAAMVGWSPDGITAYAGTSGAESAFSHSKNDGYTWNQ